MNRVKTPFLPHSTPCLVEEIYTIRASVKSEQNGYCLCAVQFQLKETAIEKLEPTFQRTKNTIFDVFPDLALIVDFSL